MGFNPQGFKIFITVPLWPDSSSYSDGLFQKVGGTQGIREESLNKFFALEGRDSFCICYEMEFLSDEMHFILSVLAGSSG